MPVKKRRTMMVALMLGGLHLFFMGYQGWLKPAYWHSGLTPISLLAFTFFVIGYLINLPGSACNPGSGMLPMKRKLAPRKLTKKL